MTFLKSSLLSCYVLIQCLAFALIGIQAHAGQFGTITGTLLDESLQPIPHAVFSLPSYLKNDVFLDAKIAQDGKFELQIKASDTYDRQLHQAFAITIHAEGYAVAYIPKRYVTLFAAKPRSVGNVVLQRGIKYVGTIQDQNGVPIPTAEVITNHEYHLLGHTVTTLTEEAITKVDASGSFTTPALTPGLEGISVRANGYIRDYYSKEEIQQARLTGMLPPIQLMSAQVVEGQILYPSNEPVIDATVYANGEETRTDSEGHFTLHGFGEKCHFQLQVYKDGTELFNLGVSRENGMFQHVEVQSNQNTTSPSHKDLVIQLPFKHYILGNVVDDETGKPIFAKKVVVCDVVRDESGKPRLIGCGPARYFEQREPGLISIGVPVPNEYHIVVSADGYLECEQYFTVTSKPSATPVRFALKRDNAQNRREASYAISGKVDFLAGYAGPYRLSLTGSTGGYDAVNAPVYRNRTISRHSYVIASTYCESDHFELLTKFDGDAYLMVETAKGIIAMHGPFPTTKLAIEPITLKEQATGSVTGKIDQLPTHTRPVYAILFDDRGLLYETRVKADGSYAFLDVLPGTYGLKLTDESELDYEVPTTGYPPHLQREVTSEDYSRLFQKPNDAWKQATRVDVIEGKTTQVKND